MRATELQAPNTTTPMCVAHIESGQRCVRPALPGQLVCGIHQKQRHGEVTRSYLAKCEEILGSAAQHARNECGSEKVQGEILKLKIAVNRLRSTLGVFALFALCLCAQAQSTFVNYRLNFVGGTATTNISVGANVVFRLVNSHGANLTGGTFGVQFPGGPVFQYNIADPNFDPAKPILGPCTVSLSVQGTAGAAALFLGQFDTVNATLPAQGVIVQPSGHGAAIALQSSADLVSWSPATNGVYSAGQNRFFRMSLNLQ